VNSHPGLDFNNMFTKSFMAIDHNRAKKYSQLVSIFALFGSVLVKAALKINVSEIDPRIPFLAVLTHDLAISIRLPS
jgi:hypothetical protein